MKCLIEFVDGFVYVNGSKCMTAHEVYKKLGVTIYRDEIYLIDGVIKTKAPMSVNVLGEDFESDIKKIIKDVTDLKKAHNKKNKYLVYVVDI